jgi:hypothetical protein
MKLYQSRTLLCFALSCAFVTLGAAQARGKRGAPPPGPPPAQDGTYTTLSGAITQLNYDREGDVEGFLLSSGALIHLPERAAAHVAPAVRVGDNVQITGYAQEAAAGIQTVEAQSVQDRTSGKTFAIPQPGPGAPYSGSGRIQQLNYGPDGDQRLPLGQWRVGDNAALRRHESFVSAGWGNDFLCRLRANGDQRTDSCGCSNGND